MKVVTFGEIMMRISPEGFNRFVQTEKFDITYGGAEANVALSLANFGINTSFITKLPNNELGQSAINSLRKFGVDTSSIVRGGERIGIYFSEKGASQRPSKVIYDRAHSSISEASIDDFDFDKLLEGVDWFHFTGITPALSDSCAEICLKALEVCKKKNITVSCDLNFRKKLWSSEKANKVMSKLCEYVDYLIANEEDSKDVFNIEATNTDINTGVISEEGYIEVAKKLTERFSLKGVAITLRESISASVNNWSGMLYKENKAFFSKKYTLNIVDRVGGGDSFGAGLIYSLLNNFDNDKTINFAVCASALKHSINGDYNLVSVNEVNTLLNGNGSGRVQR